VLGYHGCDIAVAGAILMRATDHLKPSTNKWDWLGDGIYFWENDPVRAEQFAKQGAADGQKVTKGRIQVAWVVGAIIDLGICCNLYDQTSLTEISAAYADLKSKFDTFKAPLPENKGNGRFLDRAVFQHMHELRRSVGLPAYQTIRGGFPEGGELYPGAGLSTQNHIQIAVLDTTCIRGYFLPRKT
jgi:hypothetical protein